MHRRNLEFHNNKNYDQIVRDRIELAKLSEVCAQSMDGAEHYIITN